MKAERFLNIMLIKLSYVLGQGFLFSLPRKDLPQAEIHVLFMKVRFYELLI